MKRQVMIIIAVAFIFVSLLLNPAQVMAQVSMADYTATPPFASDAVPPNVLLLLDNSGSMNQMAFTTVFDSNTAYTGVFDATECYQYDATVGNARFVFDPAANPGTPGTCTTAPYDWSGNLLNYASMRKIDISKVVMVGGMCAVSRDVDLACPSVKAQDITFTACCKDQTQSIPIASAANLMPSTLIPGSGNVYFHLKGSSSTLKGQFCVDDDSSRPSGGTCENWSSSTENETHVIRADQSTPTTGVIQEVGTKARFGLMEFDASSSQGGNLIADIGSDLSTMVAGVEGTRPETWTPLAESLYDGVRYFAQVPSTFTTSHFPTGSNATDPYYFNAPQWASTSAFVPCCESFIMVFTDGESTQDQGIPSSLRDIADAVHGPHCTGVGCAGHRTDYPSSGSHYLDDVAYWAHTNDLRQGTLPIIGGGGNDLLGEQRVTVYTFFAFGSGSELLQSAAKAGGFQDQNGNSLPDLTEEWDKVNNISGASVPDGIPDTYFESDDAFQLKARLLSALTSILQRSTSGSSVSVLASSSTGEGALYQSFFFPSTFEGLRNISWTGYTEGFFLDAFGNLREDTNADHRLVYKDDNIIVSRFDPVSNAVLVDRFLDADEDGFADSVIPISTVGMKQLAGIWEAGNRLALTPSTSRNIQTWIDQNENGLVDGGEQIALTTANTALLDPYIRPGAAPFTTNNIINFTRGDQIAGLRDRQLTVGGSLNVWKLGDSIYAQPIVVGAPTQRFDVIYGDSSYTAYFSKYKDRRQVAYVGANDGMLHAFNAGYFHRGDDPSTLLDAEHGWFTRTPTDNSGGPQLGDELWGFIPQELLPHLQWLADPNYTHVYYVDLTPKVTDVRIFTPDVDHPNGWGTILMGGFRLGGSCGACAAGTGAPPMAVTADFDNNAGTADTTRTFYSAYFVLDITNPEVDPKLLWSFSSSDLGLTTAVPSMLRVLPKTVANIIDNTEAKWYMVVGSGPTGFDGGTVQSGNTYAIDLKVGPGTNNGSVTVLPAETLDSFMASTLTIDRNFDYRVDVTYMGSTIHDGSLPWRGKLYRLTTDCPVTPCTITTWGIDAGSGKRQPTEILDTFPSDNSLQLGPIVTTPAAAIDDANKLWVFSGTGRYFNQVDKTSTDQQYFVGVKDSVLNNQCTESTRVNCQENDLINMSNATVCLLGTGTCGAVGNEQVQNVPGASTFPALIALVQASDGWYTTLPNLGERALSRPRVFSGIVFFPTFAPTVDICTVSGESRLYALFYQTGSAYSTPVIGTSGAGTETIKRSTSMGQGLATEAVIHVGKGGQHAKFGIFSQNSLGQVTRIESYGTGSVTSRFLSWYDQRA